MGHNGSAGGSRSETAGVDRRAFLLGLGTLALTGCSAGSPQAPGRLRPEATAAVEPSTGATAERPRELLDVIESRRSLRAFADQALSDEEVAVLLRAAQGVTDAERGLRAVPSAGALYPLTIYVAVPDGLRRYEPETDEAVPAGDRDLRADLASATWGQDFIGGAAAVFVVTGNYSRATGKYGERGVRYVHLEAGHAAQNLLLAAVGLGLGGVTVGSYTDDDVRSVIGASRDETPLYVIPVGVPA